MKTRDPVNQYLIDQHSEFGSEELGLMNSSVWREDPRRLVFTLARYKFVAKMLRGLESVAEIGCGDGFGARIVRQEVQDLLVTDFDPVFIKEAAKHIEPDWPITLATHDILSGPYINGDLFDAAFSLDVIEHIPQEKEDIYLRNISNSIKPGGVFICGAPSLESQEYASPPSREGHINCKTGEDLKNLLEKYYNHAFLFGMNDEVLHTGFSPMCQYLFVLAVGNKSGK